MTIQFGKIYNIRSNDRRAHFHALKLIQEKQKENVKAIIDPNADYQDTYWVRVYTNEDDDALDLIKAGNAEILKTHLSLIDKYKIEGKFDPKNPYSVHDVVRKKLRSLSGKEWLNMFDDKIERSDEWYRVGNLLKTCKQVELKFDDNGKPIEETS